MTTLTSEKTFTYQGVLNKNPSVLIDWFDDLGTNNPHSFLSNFYEGSPFEYRGRMWATSEHAYAAAKVYGVDEALYNQIQQSTDPQEAKTLGRLAPVIRHDWEQIKYNEMKSIVSEKFLSHPHLTMALLDTGNAYLQEGTFWDDRVWGVDLIGADGQIDSDPLNRKGRNWLGTILMELRAKIRLAVDTEAFIE